MKVMEINLHMQEVKKELIDMVDRRFEAFMGLLIPGLGQMLQGRTGRGVGFLLGSILLLPAFGIGIIFYLWSIVDAYRFEEDE